MVSLLPMVFGGGVSVRGGHGGEAGQESLPPMVPDLSVSSRSQDERGQQPSPRRDLSTRLLVLILSVGSSSQLDLGLSVGSRSRSRCGHRPSPRWDLSEKTLLVSLRVQTGDRLVGARLIG